MEKDKFYRMMKKNDYEKLEEQLQKEYRKSRNNDTKYQLGICYSEQYKKIDKALDVFKELLSIDYKAPYIFYFNAKHSKSNIEGRKIINEGLRCFPDNNLLQNKLLFYLDGKEKEKYFNEMYCKDTFSVSSIFDMISYYYEKGLYKKAYTLLIKEIKNIKAEGYNDKEIDFIYYVLCYLNNKEIDVEKMNSVIISLDNTTISFILRLIEINVIFEKDFITSTKMLDQMDYCEKYPEEFIELINLSDYSSACFMIKDILFSIIENSKKIFNKDEQLRKMKIIEDLHMIYYENHKFKKSELRTIEKELKDELKYTNNKKILEYLFLIYEKLADYKKYFDTYIDLIDSNLNNEEYLINFNNFNEEQSKYVEEYINKKIEITKYNSKKYQNLIDEFIQDLFKREKYIAIVNISKNIDYKKLNYLNFGFELAYSLNEVNMIEDAKKMYEEYLIKYPNSSAVLNNLGIIYENEGKYNEALKLYIKSEEISHDTKHVTNINRCKKNIEEKEIEEEKELEGLELFKEENIWVINKLKLFYSNSDEKGNVICSYKKLPSLIKCDAEHAQELLNTFLKNSYLSKNINHGYDTSSSVYKINSKILVRIKELENNYEIISNFTNYLNDFSIDKLNDIDYTTIKVQLSKISDDEIKRIFIRDYDELVFNYLSNQSKTVIIMGGSILELILLYVLEKNNIQKYKVGISKKSKKIDEMDITEMLEVIDLEKIITNAPQKIIDGTKHFRNFIHPGKELREKKLDIDKQTVDLVMSIVRWLILTIKFD